MLIKDRCRSSRHHEAQGQWLLHCCCEHLRCSLPQRPNLLRPFKSVHAATRKTLLKVKGFSEVKVEKIKEAIAKLQVSPHHCSTSVMQQRGGYRHAENMAWTSLQYPVSLQPLSSVTIGSEYAKSRPEASSWIRFLEGEPPGSRRRTPSG